MGAEEREKHTPNLTDLHTNLVRTLSLDLSAHLPRPTELIVSLSQGSAAVRGRAARAKQMKRDNENQILSTNYWMERAKTHSQTIREQQAKILEQQIKIKKLEKRVAQMKGSTKIQEEILTLKAKRVETEKKIQEEVRAHEAELAKADEDLRERERELKMAEEDGEGA
jgi:chromosome segregation ATPase